ncbi:MAG: AI-2E family transporter [Bacilli bacterium]|nr:AI-2E family transporter [Bacilli bacterium]
MYKDRLNYKLLNILILVTIIYLGIITFDYWVVFIKKVFNLTFPFIIAFIIAYALSPIVRKIEAKGVRKKLAVGIVVAAVIAIFAALIGITIPIIYDQLIVLSKNIGTIINDLSKTFNIDILEYQSTINDYLNQIIMDMGKYISDGLFNIISQSVNFFTKFIIVFIVSIYFLAEMENIRNAVKYFLSKQNKKVYKLIKNIDNELGHWLEGLCIFMAIQLIEYSLLFWIVGHPNWLLLGLLACLTTVIPYFGGWITNIIAVILASVVSTKLFVATLIICFIFPNIDGYIISPRVYGKTNNIKPLWTIFAVTVMGGLLGLFGILFSLPTYLVLNCIFQFFKEDIKEKIEAKK